MQKMQTTQTVTVCPITDKSVIQVTGDDRQQFLQGQVTANLDSLQVGETTLACQCSAKGKTWAIFQIFCAEDHYLMVTDQGCVENSLRELKKYGVFSKVEFTDVTEQYQLLGLVADKLSEAVLQQLTIHEPTEQSPASHAQNDNGDIWLVHTPSPVSRYTLLAPTSISIEIDGAENLDKSEASFWNALDIQAGIPKLNAELSEEFVPQMMNLQALNAISFKKGCYMGQEVVARTKYLGKNKRAGAILVSNENVEFSQGETLELQLGENWRRIGTLLYSANWQGKTWAFAVLPNDLENDANLRLQSNPDVTFEMTPLPYSLED